MTDITIDGTALSTLGLKTKYAHLIAVGQPKQQGSGKEDLTSENYNLPNSYSYRESSPTVEFCVFGKFGSPLAADTALYTLYGLLVQSGEHSIVHTNGTTSESVKAIMHRGSRVDIQRYGAGLVVVVKIEMIKTDD